MRCLKVLGERVMARDFERQEPEIRVRVSQLNRFAQPGMPTTVVAGQLSGLGVAISSDFLCNKAISKRHFES